MFSNIGNIFTAKPREAENTDTRLGIRRHDPDQERRKRKAKDGDEADLFDMEDNATVSIDALRLFLENFLKTLAEKEPASPQDKPEDAINVPDVEATAQPPAQDHISGQAAQAAGAYQHVSEGVHRTGQIADNETAAPALGLESHEVRSIHTLLEDLKTLSAQNIEYLKIERSDSFLHSLEQAVRKVKKQL